jgi:hypothetical protein
MRVRAAVASALLTTLVVVSACSSSKTSRTQDSGVGLRVIDAVVVERSEGPSGAGGVGAYSGSGNYYMTFEAHEGDATARYHLEVNRTQWFRFQEGAHVRITLNNNILQDIRSID